MLSISTSSNLRRIYVAIVEMATDNVDKAAWIHAGYPDILSGLLKRPLAQQQRHKTDIFIVTYHGMSGKKEEIMLWAKLCTTYLLHSEILASKILTIYNNCVPWIGEQHYVEMLFWQIYNQSLYIRLLGKSQVPDSCWK